MTEATVLSLNNDQLDVRISNKGAELQSVICDGLERIWQGDPDVWGRRAPLLFPLIGRLRDGQYELHKERFAAPMHGFCRDRIFNVEQLSPTHVRFTTTSDQFTRAVYPFDFRLAVEFSLEGNTIVKTHTVQNTGTEWMPFEIGGHEAYATCLLPDETMSDYYIQFNGINEIEMFGMDADGILTLPKTIVPLESGRLTKTPEQLSIDTIILENVPNSTAKLASTSNDHTVIVEFSNFPYLGIWTIAGQTNPKYICIEPWSALPDGDFMPRELSQKPGVRTLSPNDTAQLTYRISFE